MSMQISEHTARHQIAIANALNVIPFRRQLRILPLCMVIMLALSTQSYAQADNDTRANAAVIVGERTTIRRTLEGCSWEPGEPSLPHAMPVRRSCWWKWSAGQDGSLTILQRTFPTDPAIDSRWLIQVYALSDSAGTWQGLQEIEGQPLQEAASTYHVAAGETYLIRLADSDSISVAQTQSFEFDVQFSALIAELDPSGSTFPELHSPVIHVRTSLQAKPTALVLLRRISKDYSRFSWLTSVQETQTSLPARFPLPMDPPNFYRWSVMVSNLDGTLDYAHVLKVRVLPANDDFLNAKPFQPSRESDFAYLNTATVEPGEPGIEPSPTNHTCWYRWTAPGEGWVDVINNQPAVYIGDQLSTLQPAPEIKPASPGSPLRFRSSMGVTYSIQVRASYPIDSEETVNFQTFNLIYFPPKPSWLSTNRTVYRIGENISLGFFNISSRSPLESYWVQVGASTFPAPISPPWVVSLPGFGPGQYSATLYGRLASGQVISNTPMKFIVSEAKGDPAQAERLLGNAGSLMAGTQLGVPVLEGSTVANVYYRWQAPAAGFLVVYSTAKDSVAPSTHLFDSIPDPINFGLPSLNGSYYPYEGVVWPVSNEVTYLLRYQTSMDAAPQRLNWLFTQGPGNDMIQNAEALGTPPFQAFGVGWLATRETNEPPIITPIGRSLWWSWTPASSGLLDVRVTAPSILDIFEKGTLPNLTKIRTLSQQSGIRRFVVQKGKSLLLRSDMAALSASITSWSASFTAASPNTEWEQAILLGGVAHQFPIPLLTKVNRDLSFPQPYPTAVLEPFPLWWKWIAPASGTASVIAYPQGHAEANVLEGTRLETLEEAPFTRQPNGLLQFSTIAGNAYYLKITPHQSLTSSPIASLSMNLPPANDSFTNATILSGPRDTSTGSTFNATSEAFEPLHADIYGGRSCWYEWSAPWSGRARLIISTPIPFNLLTAIYAGSSVHQLSALASRSGPTPLNTEFAVEQGHPYFFAVDSTHGDPLQFSIQIEMGTPAPPPILEILPAPNTRSMILQIRSLHGRDAILEFSNNLSDWTPLKKISTTQEPLVLEILPEPEPAQVTFFRVVTLP